VFQFGGGVAAIAVTSSSFCADAGAFRAGFPGSGHACRLLFGVVYQRDRVSRGLGRLLGAGAEIVHRVADCRRQALYAPGDAGLADAEYLGPDLLDHVVSQAAAGDDYGIAQAEALRASPSLIPGLFQKIFHAFNNVVDLLIGTELTYDKRATTSPLREVWCRNLLSIGGKPLPITSPGVSRNFLISQRIA
jgi:hypothetical protein